MIIAKRHNLRLQPGRSVNTLYLTLLLTLLGGCSKQESTTSAADTIAATTKNQTEVDPHPSPTPSEVHPPSTSDEPVSGTGESEENPIAEMSARELFQLFNPFDLTSGLSDDAPVSADFFAVLQPNEQQQAMLVEAATKLKDNRRRKADLNRQFPFDSEQRDDPEVNRQFSALAEEYVRIAKKANEDLELTITDDQRRALLRMNGGLTMIFRPWVQRLVGIDEHQAQLMENEWNNAEAAIQHASEELGEGIFYGEGQQQMMMLRHNQLSHFWWRLSAGQIANLQAFGIEKRKQVAPITWLSPRSTIATAATVQIKFGGTAGPSASPQVVVVRAIVELGSQRQEILTALPLGKFETRNNCRLSNFIMERRRRDNGDAQWSDWSAVTLESFEKVLLAAEGVESSETFSPLLASPVATAPLPTLASGSWETVEGHPEATARLGHKIFRFPDFTVEAGKEYQYRVRLKWWFYRTGELKEGAPLKPTEVETPFGEPSNVVKIVPQATSN